MKFNLLTVLSLLQATLSMAAIVTVEDWQFNTTTDTEGWSGSQTSNFDVRATVAGGETVLSASSGHFTVVGGVDHWQTISVDLTKGGTESYTTDISSIRIDPEGNSGGFEVDYVTLTAQIVPEPSSQVFLLSGFLSAGFINWSPKS